MASVPASAPGPNTATKNRANTSVFTERVQISTSRAIQFNQGHGVTLRAARKPNGSAIATPSTVPTVAMCMESSSALCISAGYAATSGGHIRFSKSATCSGASSTNSGMTSTERTDSTTAATMTRYTTKRAMRSPGV